MVKKRASFDILSDHEELAFRRVLIETKHLHDIRVVEVA